MEVIEKEIASARCWVARIRQAYVTSANTALLEGFATSKAKAERPALVSFLNAWKKLDIEEQYAVSFELARLLSPNGGDMGGDELMLTVDPHDLDVGLAAIRAAETGLGRPGAPIRLPGLKEAAKVAFQIWIERENPAEIGAFWRVEPKEKMMTAKERKGKSKTKSQLHNRYRPYPSLKFVADAVAVILPRTFPNRQALLIAVDSQLRALRQSGAI